MDLFALSSGLVGAVNPFVPATLRVSTGAAATAPDGTRIPGYAPDRRVQAQVQDLSQRDILHLDSLNVQGSQKVIYLRGQLSGVSRPNQKGGDLVLLADGSEVWLTTSVMESWHDWCKVSVTQQNGA